MTPLVLEVYPPLGHTFPDAGGVLITAEGAIVDNSEYIRTALAGGFLLLTDPLDIFQPVDRSGGGVGGGGLSFRTTEDLKAFVGTTEGQVATTLGCLTPGDGGGGDWWWDAADAESVDNVGTVVGESPAGRWKRIFSGAINAKWFGAVGDGETADHAAIQSAIAEAQSSGAQLHLPTGEYLIGATLTITSDIAIFGTGESRTKFVAGVGVTPIMQINPPFAGAAVRLTDFAFSGGATQLFLNGEPSDPAQHALSRLGGFRNILFTGFTVCGLRANGGMIGVSHHHLHFIGVPGAGAIGYHQTGSSSLNATQFHNLLVVACGTGIRLEETAPTPGAGGMYGVAFYNLILEANAGAGMFLKGVMVDLYSPWLESNGSDGSADVVLDSNYAGGPATVTRVSMHSPVFSNPHPAQILSSGRYSGKHCRVRALNHVCTVAIKGYFGPTDAVIDMENSIVASGVDLADSQKVFVLAALPTNSYVGKLGALSTGGMQLGGFPTWSNTGIDVRAGALGGSTLLQFSQAYGVGNSTRAAVYHLRSGVDDTGAGVDGGFFTSTFVAGEDFMNFMLNQTGTDPGILFVQPDGTGAVAMSVLSTTPN